MRSTLFGVRVLVLTILVGGCASSYAPSHPVAPLLDEQGDVSVGANVRPFFPKRGATAYVAAAPMTALRVFVAGSLTHYDGQSAADEAGRSMSERNYTMQIEGAAGWATIRRGQILELLGGFGFGRTTAHQCRRDIRIDELRSDQCQLWVDSRSWFLRPFAQLHTGRRRKWGVFGQGLRIAAVRYSFDALFDEPSDRVSTVVSLEPFLSVSFGFPWGKLEAQLLVPLVVSSPDVRYTSSAPSTPDEPPATYSARLVETPAPRLSLGIRANLDELWRKRKSVSGRVVAPGPQRPR